MAVSRHTSFASLLMKLMKRRLLSSVSRLSILKSPDPRPLPFFTNPKPSQSPNNATVDSFTAFKQQRRTLIVMSDDNSSKDSESDEEEEAIKKKQAAPQIPTKPFYDPFNKKPVIEEPDDPTDLQEVFHKMREDGLTQAAVKMCDGLTQDGLTHEALQLFAVMKDKGQMPDVVAHTAVLEAYAKAGKPKDALKVYMRMLASGVMPNSYTYSVLIQGLCRGGMLDEAAKRIMQMLSQGKKPNAPTYVTVAESYLSAGREADLWRLLDDMRGKGFVPDDKKAREHMNKTKRFNRRVMDVLFGEFK